MQLISIASLNQLRIVVFSKPFLVCLFFSGSYCKVGQNGCWLGWRSSILEMLIPFGSSIKNDV